MVTTYSAYDIREAGNSKADLSHFDIAGYRPMVRSTGTPEGKLYGYSGSHAKGLYPTLSQAAAKLDALSDGPIFQSGKTWHYVYHKKWVEIVRYSEDV